MSSFLTIQEIKSVGFYAGKIICVMYNPNQTQVNLDFIFSFQKDTYFGVRFICGGKEYWVNEEDWIKIQSSLENKVVIDNDSEASKKKAIVNKINSK